jgi:predicted GNAT family acetyltransferase
VELSGGPVGGILGPHDGVVLARVALGLEGAEERFWSREILYALRLDELLIPTALADGRITTRKPHADEIDALLDWRMEYCAETTKIPDTPKARADERLRITKYQENGHHFVANLSGVPVAYSTFNATVADLVQIGGVWTPPALRGRGYARCAVAGSLLDARDRGMRRAVLFTGETNLAAQASYVAIGFRPIGNYAMLFFRQHLG